MVCGVVKKLQQLRTEREGESCMLCVRLVVCVSMCTHCGLGVFLRECLLNRNECWMDMYLSVCVCVCVSEGHAVCFRK